MKLKNCFLFFLGMLLVSNCCVGQSSNENYIKVYKAIIPLPGDLLLVNDNKKVMESVTYLDGLGRPVQSVDRQSTPTGYDLVSFWVYDEYGRKTKSFLPYPAITTNGNSKSDLFSNQASFYKTIVGNSDGANAFSLQQLESSDLNRILKQGAPGTTWQPVGIDSYLTNDHTIKKRILANGLTEVMCLKLDDNGQIIKDCLTLYYPATSLMVNKTYDEKNNQVIEFLDKEGRTICKKVQSSKPEEALAFAETYYIYDDFGNLVVVLPPEAVVALKIQIGN